MPGWVGDLGWRLTESGFICWAEPPFVSAQPNLKRSTWSTPRPYMHGTNREFLKIKPWPPTTPGGVAKPKDQTTEARARTAPQSVPAEQIKHAASC
ncbi:hypothetical protein EJB05_11492, partial [Eragrostis curvula]